MKPERLGLLVTTLLGEADLARRSGRAYCVPIAWAEAWADELGELMHELRSDVPGCLVCGVPLVQPATGRPRKYCSKSHRDKAARAA